MSSNSYVEARAPSASVFGDGAYKEIIKVEWGQNRGALFWQNLCCYLSPCAHRKGHMVTAEKVAVCKLGKKGLNGMEFSGTLILDFLPPEPCENNFLVCKLPICGVVLWWPKQTNTVPGCGSCPHAGIVLKTGVLLGVSSGTWDSYQFCSQTVLWNFSFSQSAFSCFH